MVSMLFEKGVEGEVRLPEMDGLTIFRQGRRMSQFEHYTTLAKQNGGNGMFTDIVDDLWHEV